MTSRLRCFFDIQIGGNDGKEIIAFMRIFDGYLVGRIVLELFNDICPRTCENFRALCTGKLDEIAFDEWMMFFFSRRKRLGIDVETEIALQRLSISSCREGFCHSSWRFYRR